MQHPSTQGATVGIRSCVLIWRAVCKACGVRTGVRGLGKQLRRWRGMQYEVVGVSGCPAAGGGAGGLE